MKGLPPAKLRVSIGAWPKMTRVWVCWSCSRHLIAADSNVLGERDTWKCPGCGELQMLGRAVLAEALGRVPAAAPSLPPGLDIKTLQRIESECALFTQKNPMKKPSKNKIAELTGINRTTVAKYWPHRRNC